MKLKHVYYMPDELEQGVLYVSLDLGVAIHLCACGKCGWKTVTPIGPGGWTFTDGTNFSLSPSIGNAQFPCKSHYWIKEAQVIWC